MCRSKTHGGRRCTGGKCAESRRARQRAYQARKRATAKAFTEGFLEAQIEHPVSPELAPTVLKLLPPLTVDDIPRDEKYGDNPTWQRARLRDTLKEQGRYSVLDDPITESERDEIRNMSVDQVADRISALRDHFNVDLIVNADVFDGEEKLAEKVTSYIGDVSNTWIDAQLSEELESADEFKRTFDTSYTELQSRKEANTARIKAANQLAYDDEERKAARVEQQELTRERIDLQNGLKGFAKMVGEARASVVTDLLAKTVGTKKPITYGALNGQKKLFKRYMDDTAAVFPDAWKEATENLDPLVVRYSDARAHYAKTAAVKKKVQVKYENSEVKYALFEEPTEMEISSRRRFREKVTVMAGGDPDNPEHVKIMEAARDRLNAEDAEWVKAQPKGYLTAQRRSKPDWVIETNSAGHLMLVETLPSSGTRTVGYEALIRVDKDKSTFVHEMSHRMEDGNPHIAAVCREFIRRRTTNADGERDRPIRYYRDSQPVYEDNFPEAYTGKVYAEKHTEVLSMGMEMLMFGEHGGGVGLKMSGSSYTKEDPNNPGRLVSDREHMNLVLGLLMSAKKTGA